MSQFAISETYELTIDGKASVYVYLGDRQGFLSFQSVETGESINIPASEIVRYQRPEPTDTFNVPENLNFETAGVETKVAPEAAKELPAEDSKNELTQEQLDDPATTLADSSVAQGAAAVEQPVVEPKRSRKTAPKTEAELPKDNA